MKFHQSRPLTSKDQQSFNYNTLPTHSQLKTRKSLKEDHQEIKSSNYQEWEKKANKVNERMKLKRLLTPNRMPYEFLSKCGGLFFKEGINQMNRSRQKCSRSNSKPNKQITLYRDSQQVYHRNISIESKSSNLKKYFRHFKTRKNVDQHKITKHISPKNHQINNLFYQSFVERIGFNMQYDAKFRFAHIKNIKAIQGNFTSPNHIIFYTKDNHITTNPMGLEINSNVHPICISLYPEFFDAKTQAAKIKRQKYIQKLKKKMNRTYDPQLMSQIPMVTHHQPFNPDIYPRILRTMAVSIQNDYKRQWAENIVDKINYVLSQSQIVQLFRQVWDLFNESNSISSLDYILKDPKQASKLKTGGYLCNIIINSNRILYHGGYSKKIYHQWANYVESSRKNLQPKLQKLNNITQAVYGWFEWFRGIKFIDIQFIKMLNRPMQISFLQKVQITRIQQSLRILKNIWLRGIQLIINHRLYLFKNKNEYRLLIFNTNQLKKYLKQAKIRFQQLHSFEKAEQFYIKFYQNYLKSLHSSKAITSKGQLSPIMLPPNTQRPNINSLLVLLNIQFSSMIDESFNQLRSYVLNPPQKPLLKLNMIVDRQTLKFLEPLQSIMDIFKRIVQKLFEVNIKGNNVVFKFDKSDLLQMEENSTVEEYPQIMMSKNQSDKYSWINIGYKYQFIHKKPIEQIFSRISQYYAMSLEIIKQFEPFLPFIKLTTSKLFFKENAQLSHIQMFKRDIQTIKNFKQMLKSIPSQVYVKLFQIDCIQPIKAIQERINQIEYLIDQKFLNKIFDEIHYLQQTMNQIKSRINNCQLIAQNMDHISQQLIDWSEEIKIVKHKFHLIGKDIYFYINEQRNPGNLIMRYQCAIKIRQEIQLSINKLKSNKFNSSLTVFQSIPSTLLI